MIHAKKCYVIGYRKTKGKGKGKIHLTTIVGDSTKLCKQQFEKETAMSFETRKKLGQSEDYSDEILCLPCTLRVEVRE